MKMQPVNARREKSVQGLYRSLNILETVFFSETIFHRLCVCMVQYISRERIEK